MDHCLRTVGVRAALVVLASEHRVRRLRFPFLRLQQQQYEPSRRPGCALKLMIRRQVSCQGLNRTRTKSLHDAW